MNRHRFFMFAIVLGAALALAAPSMAGDKPSRPNIVQIMADDLGWGAVGYNGHPHIRTPNMDRLAKGGLIFERGYSMPVCSPTRASLQVGFHGGHTWTDWNIRWPAKGFRERSVTIGTALSRAGYVTAAFGKFGFGGTKGHGNVLRSNPKIDNPTTVPTNQGYDVFFGCLDHVRAHTYFMDSLWRSNTDAPHGLKLLPTGNTKKNRFNHYSDDLYAKQANRFVRKFAPRERPFYLQLHFQIPHAPFGHITKLEGWFDAYSDVDTSGWSKKARRIAAMITRMDRHIGRLVRTLKDPNQDGNTADSVLDETLIVFISDNGGYGSTKFDKRMGFNGPLRGSKGSVLEGGIRVPTFAFWPGTIQPGRTSNRPVDLTDFLPTFAELAGGRVPAGIDGVSFVPTLTERGRQRPRKLLSFESQKNWSIIRGDLKLVHRNGKNRLFNVEEDPGEHRNLLKLRKASKQERTRYQTLKQQLLAAAEEQGLTHGSAIHKAQARKRGNNRGRPFYVTFPRWNGSDGASMTDASNWDAGGPPVETWVARMQNHSDSPRSAVLRGTFKVLGLEIGGGRETSGGTSAQGGKRGARQTVRVAGGGMLHGVNEVRVAGGGRLHLVGGTVRARRWVDVWTDGVLSGTGQVEGTVYNDGRVEAAGLKISGDLRQSTGSQLMVSLTGEEPAPLMVGQTLHARGRLVVHEKADELRPGDAVQVIQAGNITGRFDEVDLPDLSDGMSWDTRRLYDSGTLRVK